MGTRIARIALVVNLAGCVDPRASVAPPEPTDIADLPFLGPPPGVIDAPYARVNGLSPDVIWAAPRHVSDVVTPPPPPALDSSVASLLPDLEDLEVDWEERGGALQEALDALPQSQVDKWGLLAAGIPALYGGPEELLCEEPLLLNEIEEDGEVYEGRFNIPSWLWLVSDPRARMTTLSDPCRAALIASGVDAARASGDCTDTEEHSLFEEGGDCRACLEVDGDIDRCEDDLECPPRAPLEIWASLTNGEVVWYDTVDSAVWACAPEWIAPMILLYEELPDDGALPPAWEYPLGQLCLPYYDDTTDVGGFACDPGDPAGHTLEDIVGGYIDTIRRPGDEGTPNHARLYLARQAEFGAMRFELTMGWSRGFGVVGAPFHNLDTNGDGTIGLGDEDWGFAGWGGWGLNPTQLRPDATDPEDPEQTLAREFLSALTMKTSTTRDGIPVWIYDRNRCDPDAWEEIGDGIFRCTNVLAPDGGWHNDGRASWWDSVGQSYTLPIATLASTGLRDPRIPGGFVTHLQGSPILADPDWDDCVWPDTFLPDEMPFQDHPDQYEDTTGALTGQTYRFGKDPENPVRLVMNTNHYRGFCPEYLE